MAASFVIALVTSASPALAAGDRAACRRARRTQTVEGWTTYVLEHPEGRCADEAVGELFVLNVGRLASAIVKDRTKVALALAQLGRMTNEDFDDMSNLFGGGLGGLGGGGLGGLGGGLGGGMLGSLGGIGGLDGQGSDDNWDSYDSGLYDYPSGNTLYASFFPDAIEGSWDQMTFAIALDDVLLDVQTCYTDTGRRTPNVFFQVTFSLIEGTLTVEGIEPTIDTGDNEDENAVEACLWGALEGTPFSEYTGRYTYQMEFY